MYVRSVSGVWVTAVLAAVMLAGCEPDGKSRTRRTGAGEARLPDTTAERGPGAAFHRQGLDAFVRWDERAMFGHMRAAWDAQPGYIPGIVDLEAYFLYGRRLPTNVRLALDSLTRRDPWGDGLCAAFVLSRQKPLHGSHLPQAAESADVGSPPCAIFLRVQVPGAADSTERLRLAEYLWHRFPDSPQLAEELLTLLTQERALDRLLRTAERMARPERHAMLRAMGLAWRANALAALGRWGDAMAAHREGDGLTRGAEPGTRFAYLTSIRRIETVMAIRRDHPLRTDATAIIEEANDELAVLGDHDDIYMTGRFRGNQATRLMDLGRLTESLALWDELVAAADTFLGETRVIIYLRRGRTLSKLGRLEAAERDLLTARRLAARVGTVEYALEVEHNLLHVYEAMGRDEPAREAGLAFIDLTRIGRLKPVRMMAYYDFGNFLRRRGEHDTARRMFEAMLAVVDSLDDYHYWAGQYYELTGDLDRALAAYQRSWRENQHDAPRALVALARLAETTGDHAQAEEYARAHDEQLGPLYPEDAPILPGLLARAGRVDEAIRELRTARDAARANGQVAAWAGLTFEAAAIQLERGNVDRAASLADSASVAAESVAAAAVAIRGRGLSALARVRRGGPSQGAALVELHEAVEEAERLRDAQLHTDLLQMLGDALSTLDRTEAALAAYARAEVVSDSVARFLAHDLVRAGFRAQQLRISNHALAAILHAADHPDTPARFACWSLRRKARGIVEAGAGSGVEGDGDREGRIGLLRESREVIRGVQSSLGDDQALIDYVVLDHATAALVLTREAAHVIVLPAEAQSLSDQVRRLLVGLQPRVGSFIDLSRASLDHALARRLYRDLLAPLEPVLADRTRLTIVSDAPLHVLPFDALVRSGSRADPEYFLDRYTLAMAPSLRSAAGREHGLPAGPVVAVAASGPTGLLAADREVEAIGQAFSHREVVRLAETAATEAAVREHGSRAAILHFAAHAHASAADPDLAHLTLEEDDTDDGLLHAYEVRRLPLLPGSLVILSACGSAGGPVLRGEGPLSLSRSFLQAGARDVIGTLWPVGPTAGPLMKEFYRSLAGGSHPTDALRSAKMLLRNNHPEPFFWAPFVLVSRGS